MKLSSINFHNILTSIRFLLVIPYALLRRKGHPNVWIISERPDQACDNGLVFFRYVRKNHPSQEIYYLIEMGSSDERKVKQFGSVIHFNSWKHFYYYCLSRIHISSHVNGCVPQDAPIARRLKKLLDVKDVFIPHGVSYGISEFCLEKYARLDLFVCSGRPEYDNVLQNYGYTKQQVVYTGFPRLDEWHLIDVKKNQILVMPTWRMYLAQKPDTIIEETDYYKRYQDLLNNRRLRDFIESNNLMLIFYLHDNMKKYRGSFYSHSSHIVVANNSDVDIQSLLKESALLVTDYSSVHFDFAYMEKPVIYYQFDKDEFQKKQYMSSGYSYENDGFGPIANELDQLVEHIMKMHDSGFRLQGKYVENMKRFYLVRDNNNSERVYKEIHKHFGRG